jgi:hypothetical protein
MDLVFLAKGLLFLLGVIAMQRSFAAYRARRRDPHAPRDPAADLGWRLIGIGAATFLTAGLAIQLIPRIPGGIASALFIVTAVGIVVALVGCAVAGWRLRL